MLQEPGQPAPEAHCAEVMLKLPGMSVLCSNCEQHHLHIWPQIMQCQRDGRDQLACKDQVTTAHG